MTGRDEMAVFILQESSAIFPISPVFFNTQSEEKFLTLIFHVAIVLESKGKC